MVKQKGFKFFDLVFDVNLFANQSEENGFNQTPVTEQSYEYYFNIMTLFYQ